MKRAAALFLIIILISLLCGCKAETTKNEKIKELKFTVVENVDVPEELAKAIDSKKQQPFKLSFSSEGYLYIVEGYGEQNTGGYSIQVNELYESSNAIYIDTSLVGPEKDKVVTQAKTYPYVVVKTEFIDKNIVFE